MVHISETLQIFSILICLRPGLGDIEHGSLQLIRITQATFPVAVGNNNNNNIKNKRVHFQMHQKS